MSRPLKVSIRGTTLFVPVFRNEATTRKIVAALEERLLEIESNSSRVDSQAFALQAAYLYAVEREEATETHEQESRETLVLLEQMVTRLKKILGRFAPE